MAIGTAILTGATLGGVVNTFIFKHTQNEYQQKINELEGLRVELNGHLETLLELRQQMASFWRDDSARKTGAVLDLNIQKVRNNMATVQDLLRIYNEAVSSIGGANNIMDETLGAANTILDSILE